MAIQAQVRYGFKKMPRGDASVTYELQPSVTTIKKSFAGVVSPASVTCAVYKKVGNAPAVLTNEVTLKFQRSTDATPILYASAVAVGVSEWIEFTCWQGNVLLDIQTIRVLTDASDMEIGGRNLVLKSDVPVIKTTTPFATILSIYEMSVPWDKLIGKVVTVSFDYEYAGSGSANSPNRIGIEKGLLVNGSNSYFQFWFNIPSPSTSGSGRHTKTLTVPIHTTTDKVFPAYIQRIGTGKISNIQIEVGNVATAWKPAPEDSVTTTEYSAYVEKTDKAITERLVKTVYDTEQAEIKKNILDIQKTATGITTTITENKTAQDATNTKLELEDLARKAMTSGRCLHPDACFTAGYNGVNPYKRSEPQYTGTLVVNRMPYTNSPTGSNNILRVNSVRPTGAPGRGGVYQTWYTRANAVFIQRIVARIPIGFTINSIGNTLAVDRKWLTPQIGTGDWFEYVVVLSYQSSGTFSSDGHLYITGGDINVPLQWDIALLTSYDATGTGFLVDNNLLNSTKTALETKITATANGLTTKVEKTAYDSNNIAIEEKFTEINQTAEEIKLSVEGAESRGEQLVANGSGIMGNNYNFSTLTFDPANANACAGSFTRDGANRSTNKTDNFFPVDVNAMYMLSIDLKSKNNVGVFYSFVDCYDCDKKVITSDHFMYINNTLTTLAQNLNNGDTEVKLVNTAGWKVNTGAATYQRGFIFWDYKNNAGYLYPPETYSRNAVPNLYNDASVNKITNTITLNKPWAGGLKLSGTKLSQSSSGGTYRYCGKMGGTVPTTWTSYTGQFGGVISDGYGASGKFPAGTAFCKIGMLWNWDQHDDKFWMCNLTFSQGAYNISQTEKNKAEIVVHKEYINSKVAKSDYNTDNTLRNQRFSAVEQTANQISSKVSQTDYNQNNEAINTKFSEIKQTADSISLKVNAPQGIRNYALGTEKLFTATGYPSQENYCLEICKIRKEVTGGDVCLAFDIELTGCAFTSNSRIEFHGGGDWLWNLGFDSWDVVPLINGKYHIFLTGNIPTKAAYGVFWIRLDYIVGGTITITNVVYAKGHKETDWSQAPEDFDAKMLATGVDVENGVINFTSNNTNFHTNDGKRIAMFTADGLNAEIIDAKQLNIERVICRDLSGVVVSKFNGNDNGTIQFVYPNGNTMKEDVFIYDNNKNISGVETRYYNSDGTLRWKCNVDGAIEKPSSLQDYWENKEFFSCPIADVPFGRVWTNPPRVWVSIFHAIGSSYKPYDKKVYSGFHNNGVPTSKTLFSGYVIDIRVVIVSRNGNKITYGRWYDQYTNGVVTSSGYAGEWEEQSGGGII